MYECAHSLLHGAIELVKNREERHLSDSVISVVYVYVCVCADILLHGAIELVKNREERDLSDGI